MSRLWTPGGISRRSFIKTTALAGAAALYAPAVRAATPTIKLGYVSPKTGPLAAFAEADDFIIKSFMTTIGSGLKLGDKTYAVEVVQRDSQSNPNRAAEVAKSLIVDDKIDIMLVASTPETTNPVATQCEVEGTPCISSAAPWQPFFFGQQSNPADPKPFKYVYHFFWGLEDVIAAYTNMWSQLQTNKSVGGLFPNDADGNGWGDPKLGFPPALAGMGYKLTDPGRFQDLTDDFTAQINAFRSADAEIVTGVVIPPDMTTFWTQAQQRGYRPKVASVAKAILFPVTVEALGKAGHNLSSEVWWSATHPFKSSLSGMSAGDLANGYSQATGRPWTQPIGFAHAMLEAAVDSLKRSADPTDPDANAKSIAAIDLETIVGHIKFGQDNVPPFARANIAKTPIVGGQWRLGDDGKFSLVIVDNRTAPMIPAAGQMQAIA